MTHEEYSENVGRLFNDDWYDDGYAAYRKKYCSNCKQFEDCDWIPIDNNSKIIEDFTNNPSICRDWSDKNDK